LKFFIAYCQRHLWWEIFFLTIAILINTPIPLQIYGHSQILSCTSLSLSPLAGASAASKMNGAMISRKRLQEMLLHAAVYLFILSVAVNSRSNQNQTESQALAHSAAHSHCTSTLISRAAAAAASEESERERGK
jgi:hypothetical protein